MLTAHALGRVAERLTDDDRDRVTAELQRLAPKSHGRSVAVRVARLPHAVGVPWSDESNGSDVWAVLRGGTVTTVMLRRKTQPTNPAAFGVDRVILSI